MKLNPENLSLEQLRQLWGGAEARLDDASMQRIAAAAASVERIVASGERNSRTYSRARGSRFNTAS